MPPDDDPERQVSDTLLDLFLYAPIGLILDAETMTPELARRGRQNTAAARHLGEFAVKRGLARIDEIVSQMAATPTTSAPGDVVASEPSDTERTETEEPPDETPEHDGPLAAHLAIPDYDLLAASQVVKRLDGLSDEELEAVRQYESATRDRRTILHKIARLQG